MNEYIIVCPSCDKQVSVKGSRTGQQITCPHCRVAFKVPSPSSHDANKDKGVFFAIADFFEFKLLITRDFIKNIYSLGVVALVVGCLIWLLVAIKAEGDVGVITILMPIIVLIVGNILFRLSCEAFIVFFAIHDELKELNSKMARLEVGGEAQS